MDWRWAAYVLVGSTLVLIQVSYGQLGRAPEQNWRLNEQLENLSQKKYHHMRQDESEGYKRLDDDNENVLTNSKYLPKKKRLRKRGNKTGNVRKELLEPNNIAGQFPVVQESSLNKFSGGNSNNRSVVRSKGNLKSFESFNKNNVGKLRINDESDGRKGNLLKYEQYEEKKVGSNVHEKQGELVNNPNLNKGYEHKRKSPPKIVEGENPKIRVKNNLQNLAGGPVVKDTNFKHGKSDRVNVRDQQKKVDKSSQEKSKSRISLIDRLKPQQIHISFASEVNNIVIMWATFDGEDCSVMYTQKVDGLIVNGDKGMQKEDSTRVELQESNDRGAQYIYRAQLDELLSGMQYSYYIKCTHSSDLYSFTVPSLNKTLVHSYIVLADMGTETKTLPFIVADARRGDFDAIFHIGDIAYDLNGMDGKVQVGDKYLNMIQPMAAEVPYITIAGDHERFNDFIHYRYRFSNPSLTWPKEDQQLWFSFDAGLVHFVCILTEVYSHLHSLIPKMTDWLSKDLLEANRNRAQHPWIIVMGHRPMYCSGDTSVMFHDDCADANSILRSQMEDVLNLHGVDLYISGHTHYYERTWPVFRNRVKSGNYKDPDATVHLIVGALGIEYLNRNVPHGGGGWSAFYKANKEIYGKMDVINQTHLHWRAVDGKTASEIDHMWLIQNFHGPFIKGRELHKGNPESNGVYVFQTIERSYERDLYNYCLYLFYFISFGGLLCLVLLRKRIKFCLAVFMK